MSEVEKIKELVEAAGRIVVIQADNPDADSLGSALALEQILHEMSKEPFLYCGMDIPNYLKHMAGWDRVTKDIPAQFDLSIIVDTSALSLLNLLENSPAKSWVASRPVIVLDHHAEVVCDIPYATVVLNDSSKVSTGEVIYSIAQELHWPLSVSTMEFIATSILADSLGLTTENTTADTYRVMASLIDGGVSRPKLEEQRRALSKMPPEIFSYKATLINQTRFSGDGRIAYVVIGQKDIERYSPLYNPNPLIQGEHLQTDGVLVSLAIKSYDSGRITASIRCNNAAPIASKVAEAFGGGGHAYAAGFKLEGKPLETTITDCLALTAKLLRSQEIVHETL